MKYIIDIPDNIKPMGMLDCDTEDAIRMLMSAKPVEPISQDECLGCVSESTESGCHECCHNYGSLYRKAK